MTASRKVAQVTRLLVDGGPLSALNINDESTYFLLEDGFKPGGTTWRRVEVDSPFVDGSYEVGAVKNDSDGLYSVAVKRTTQTALDAAVGVIVAAFTEQRTYTLQITIDGVSQAWKCKRADWEIAWDGPWIDDINEPIAVVSFSFRRTPIKISGSL